MSPRRGSPPPSPSATKTADTSDGQNRRSQGVVALEQVTPGDDGRATQLQNVEMPHDDATGDARFNDVCADRFALAGKQCRRRGEPRRARLSPPFRNRVAVLTDQA